MVDEQWYNKEHLEEAANGADFYGVQSLDGFHQNGNGGEEHCGQESIEQTKTWTSLWFFCEKEETKKREVVSMAVKANTKV